MAVRFRKQAVKFLQRATSQDQVKIQTKLRQLVVAVEEKRIIPFTELDIKKMKGEWKGFYRLKVANIRVIFVVDLDSSDVDIYVIGFRGDVYK